MSSGWTTAEESNGADGDDDDDADDDDCDDDDDDGDGELAFAGEVGPREWSGRGIVAVCAAFAGCGWRCAMAGGSWRPARGLVGAWPWRVGARACGRR